MSGDKNEKKIDRKPLAQHRQLIVVSVFVLFLVVLIILFYISRENNCTSLTHQVKELVKKKDYDEAATLLSKHRQCGESIKSDNVLKKIDAVEYNRYNALVLYAKDNKKDSKASAEKALEIYSTIPDNQKATAVPDNFELVDSMSNITDDIGDPLQ